ncbi:hypothetical protein H0H93_016578 [Arthromyces matolae]|nr:hypothetical protein H0H93_016578 [Arthromyces matolae]
MGCQDFVPRLSWSFPSSNVSDLSPSPAMTSPPRQVVVDDADSQIQYSGSGWFSDQGSQDKAGNYGHTYKKTSHGTKASGSFSFSFTVWGTTALTKIGDGCDPSWECFIDQTSIGATTPFQYEENNWVLCSQPTINDGPHELTVKITSAGATFWFDYLAFTPSPGASYPEAVLKVQDGDSAINYGSGWGAIAGFAQATSAVGSQMKFDFVGTSLTWVGYIPAELPHNAAQASYVIDNGGSVNVNLNGIPTGKTSSLFIQTFFSTPDLSAGPHSILVTYNGGTGASTPLVLDYLLITNVSIPSNTGTTTTAAPIPNAIDSSGTSTSGIASNNPTNTPTVTTIVNNITGVSQVNPSSGAGATKSSQSTQTALVGSNPSASSDTNLSGSTPSGSQQSQSGTPVGAIVGGVVGGLAVIALALFVFWCWRRRRRAHAFHPSVEIETATTIPTTSRRSSLSSPGSPSHRGTMPPMSFNEANSTTGDVPSPIQAPSIFSQLRPVRKGEYSNSTPSTTSLLVHEDSGVRFNPSMMVDDIPPSYTAS